MKKIIISAIVVLIAMNSIAQTQVSDGSSVHLTFKSVPIDGTLSEYVLNMTKNGFTHIGTEDGIATLKGDFAAYKGCTVVVATMKQKDLVSKITVIFPECDTWSTLSSNYFSLKEMLTEKYGKPSDSVEKFQTDLQPKDDNMKMYEVKLDRCKYSTAFESEKGSIQLSIEHDGVAQCFVMLAYYDKINGNSIRAKAIDDL